MVAAARHLGTATCPSGPVAQLAAPVLAPARHDLGLRYRHVSQLRRFLGEAAVNRLVPPGYLLDLPGDGTDVGMAQRLIREGTAASTAAEGARVLREAIGLWRGRPLAGLAGRRWFDEQAWWLESLRAQATRALTEHRLALGEHAALVAELRRMAREQPLDEDLHRQLMLALYRSGRQAESLAAYRELRSQVNEEFDAARVRYVARRQAGAIRYVSHEEAGRRLGLPLR